MITRLRDHLEEYIAELHTEEDTIDQFAGVHIQSEDLITDFLTLYKAPRLVLSVSTFCWWAGFLGNGCVIYPMVGIFQPSVWVSGPSQNHVECRRKYPIQDLMFPKQDDERVNYVDLSHLKRWKGKHEIPTLFD